jgi:hypothetical protein
MGAQCRAAKGSTMEQKTRSSQAAAIEEAQLEAIEHRIAHLMHQWMEHLIWELDSMGTGELAPAAELAERGSRLFEFLERMSEDVDAIRRTMD